MDGPDAFNKEPRPGQGGLTLNLCSQRDSRREFEETEYTSGEGGPVSACVIVGVRAEALSPEQMKFGAEAGREFQRRTASGPETSPRAQTPQKEICARCRVFDGLRLLPPHFRIDL